MDPRTPVVLTQGLRKSISSIAEGVVALEFEFRQTDVTVSLEQNMLQLSGLFQVGFKAAVDSLRILHIGLYEHHFTFELRVLSLKQPLSGSFALSPS